MVGVRSYRSPKTFVGKSKIHGRGLFAREKIKKGEIVSIKGGHIISSKMLKSIRSKIRGSEEQIADDFYIAPLDVNEVDEVMVFVNHSCEPNLGFRGDIIHKALRDIKAGEEIVADYAMHLSRVDFRMECNCQLTSCRKIITGSDWKKPDLQKKYGSNFSMYLLEKMGKI